MISKERNMPLYRQVFEFVRLQILEGTLKAREPLMSTRKLSEMLGVSRNVVLEAYEQLKAEGYIEAIPGGYTRVVAGLEISGQISRPSREKDVGEDGGDGMLAFKTGIPDLGSFPRKAWAKQLKEACETIDQSALGYVRPEGLLTLRETIANYLLRTKGLKVLAQNIIVTTGATQALALVARLLYEVGANCVLEDPSSLGVQKVVKYNGYEIIPSPVDHEGIDPSKLILNGATKFIYTTPAHQFPMGGILSASRRLALIQLAKENNSYIIEDDYDGEFRYDGNPITPMKALSDERVIYIGSFSKVLAPGLRLGYVVLPEALIKKGKLYKMFEDVHTGTIEQLALSRFIAEGHFERHLYRMTKNYRNKRDLLVRLLEETFGDEIILEGSNSGLHLVVKFTEKRIAKRIDRLLENKEVALLLVEKYSFLKGRHIGAIVLGYGHLTPEQLVRGIAELKESLEDAFHLQNMEEHK